MLRVTDFARGSIRDTSEHSCNRTKLREIQGSQMISLKLTLLSIIQHESEELHVFFHRKLFTMLCYRKIKCKYSATLQTSNMFKGLQTTLYEIFKEAHDLACGKKDCWSIDDFDAIPHQVRNVLTSPVSQALSCHNEQINN